MGVLQACLLLGEFVSRLACFSLHRYDHYAVLCELLPQALPCLGICLRALEKGIITSCLTTLSCACSFFFFFFPALLTIHLYPVITLVSLLSLSLSLSLSFFFLSLSLPPFLHPSLSAFFCFCSAFR